MLSLALVERRIKEIVKGDHSEEAVRDFVIHCLARDYLIAELKEQNENARASGKPRVILSNYCADLSTVPTVEQIEMAISAASTKARSPDEKKKLLDMKTWAEILKASEGK